MVRSIECKASTPLPHCFMVPIFDGVRTPMFRFAAFFLTLSVALAAGPCLMADSAAHAVDLSAKEMDCHETEQKVAADPACDCCEETALKPGASDLKGDGAKALFSHQLLFNTSGGTPFSPIALLPPDTRQLLPVHRGDRLLA